MAGGLNIALYQSGQAITAAATFAAIPEVQA